MLIFILPYALNIPLCFKVTLYKLYHDLLPEPLTNNHGCTMNCDVK